MSIILIFLTFSFSLHLLTPESFGWQNQWLIQLISYQGKSKVWWCWWWRTCICMCGVSEAWQGRAQALSSFTLPSISSWMIEPDSHDNITTQPSASQIHPTQPSHPSYNGIPGYYQIFNITNSSFVLKTQTWTSNWTHTFPSAGSVLSCKHLVQ